MIPSGIKILCTLGPASLNQPVIERLADRGVAYFRINLSHTAIETLEEAILTIRRFSATPICIDTEGAQVRSGPMPAGVILKDRHRITLRPGREIGGKDHISLWPESIVGHLQPGDIIAVDFDSVLLLVETIEASRVVAIVLNGGSVGSNKAVNVYPPRPLPALSPKDREAIIVARRHGIRDFALSFANSAEDVLELRALAGEEAVIMAKIESQNGVRNLDTILDVADSILIDRGDLSRDVPFENVPFLQKAIIRKASSKHRPVFVATNLLESMLVNRKPTRAELNDVINTLIDGASGLVLAAETAIGSQPVAAVDVLTLIQRYQKSLEGYRITDLLEPTSMLLPLPHGRHSNPDPRSDRVLVRDVRGLPSLDLDLETALDVEQIADGVFSPLEGFMIREELESVLDHNRLPAGAIWTLPVVCQSSGEQARSIAIGSTVALREKLTGRIIGSLRVEDKFSPDLGKLAQRWFGTADSQHPGVARLFTRGDIFLGGPITYLQNSLAPASPYKLTPAQTRMIFTIKGWRKVVAFHTRNVPHRGHEFVMQEALRRSNADGLFIHPVVGTKKPGDFTAEAILGAYDQFIEEALPGALLGAFSTYSRYAGPREAVFTALCRKNFGCTHFVVGRDHTGVGSYYRPTAARELLESLGDLGITPIFFNRVQYDEAQRRVVESAGEEASASVGISGTAVRQALQEGGAIPEWLIRPRIVAWLREQIQAGRPIFV